MSSEYTALYRRYRPQSFQDVLGQEAVVHGLQNALAKGRFTHAYLFSGPRGTGKTSVARLLARAVNCTQPSEGEPCGKCDFCSAFLSGAVTDIHEVDAASNRRIAEMRELLDQVAFSPTLGKYKVYILDEAHMLTTDAANAFLKTLEEPPGHVIFVLATTEIHKILPTISSRCQVFEFRKIGIETAAELVQEVAAKEGFELELPAARFLAQKGQGAMRDCLALLERLLASCTPPITRSQVVDAMGLVPEHLLVDLAEAILDRRPADLYRVLDEVTDQGRDPRKLLEDLVRVFQSLLRRSVGLEQALIEYEPELQSRLSRLAQEHPETRVLGAVARIDRALVEGRQGALPTFGVELGLLEAAFLDPIYGREDLETRMALLEAAPTSPARESIRPSAPDRTVSPTLPPEPSPPAPAKARAPAPSPSPAPAPAPAQPSAPAPVSAAPTQAPPPVAPPDPELPVAPKPPVRAAPKKALPDEEPLELPPLDPNVDPFDVPLPEVEDDPFASQAPSFDEENFEEAPPLGAAWESATPAPPKASAPKSEAAPAPAEPSTPEPKPESEPSPEPMASPSGFGDLDAVWKDLVREAKQVHPITAAFLREAKLTHKAGRLSVLFSSLHAFHHARLKEPKHQAALKDLFSRAMPGVPFQIDLEDGGFAPPGGGRSRNRPPEEGSEEGSAPRSRDWYEERVMKDPTLKEWIEALEAEVISIE